MQTLAASNTVRECRARNKFFEFLGYGCLAYLYRTTSEERFTSKEVQTDLVCCKLLKKRREWRIKLLMIKRMRELVLEIKLYCESVQVSGSDSGQQQVVSTETKASATIVDGK